MTQTHCAVRPIVSNVKAPTAALASYLGSSLSKNLGRVSTKHVGSAKEFAERSQSYPTDGRLFSLDVINLFGSIPVQQMVTFLRNQSDGWGPNPPAQAEPVNPPVYRFGMDSKLFCDLVELCLSFNQFSAGGKYYRQKKGLFMGSAISPPCAMIYMEFFETHVYEKLMPDHLKATIWDRYVDDVFNVYHGSDEDFKRFFDLLNSWDDYIKFTYEESVTGVEIGLGDDVVEALPFLDLVVARHLDSDANTLSNKLAIYRKPCHKGSYVHFLSCQPVSVKKSVVRSIFLRAFRFCDTVFMDKEIKRIYEDFTKLGYPRKFIDRAKTSAKKGRDHEVLIMNEQAEPRQPRPRQPFTLVIPYHKHTSRLHQLYTERGIDVIYSNKDTIGTRVRRTENKNNNTGVYVLRCTDPACDKIYVGESGDLTQRFDVHRMAVAGQTCRASTAVAKHQHRGTGYRLDIDNAVVPYRSANRHRRRIVETSLISLCTTVKDTKASSCVKDMDVIGPIVLGASPIDWKLIAAAHPTMPTHAIPKAYKRFFSPDTNPRVLVPPDPHGIAQAPPPQEEPRYHMRPRNQP